MIKKEIIHINHFKKNTVDSDFGFSVSLFTPEIKRNSENPKVAVIVLPGGGNTAASSEKMALAVGQDLQKEQERRDRNKSDGNFEISAVIQMPSIIAKDVIDSNKDRDERMNNFVLTIVKIIEENPTDEIFLVGQSMGGQNLPELVRIIQNKYPDVKIAGTIFFQAGGLFEQKKGEFLKSLLESNDLENEISQNFPTIFDIAVLEEKIRQAKEEYDSGLVLRLSSDLEKMKRNRETKYQKLKQAALEETKRTNKTKDGKLPSARINRHKIEDIFNEIERLTDQIDSTLSQKKSRKEIKQRQGLIKDIINHLVSDPTIGDTWKSPSVTIEAGKEAFLSREKMSKKISLRYKLIKNIIGNLFNNSTAGDNEEKANLTRNKIHQQINPDQTSNFTFPVGVVWAEDDVIFTANKAQSRTRNLSKLFSKASSIFKANINNFGHKPHEFAPDKFGKVVSDIITRMKFDQPKREPTTLKY